MDSFDKKIKESLTPYEDQIPEGMSWDEMAPGIMDKMEENDERKFPLFFVLLGIGLISITALGIFSYRQIDHDQGPYSVENKENRIPKVEPKIKSIDKTTTLTEDVKIENVSDTNTKKLHSHIVYSNIPAVERVVEKPVSPVSESIKQEKLIQTVKIGLNSNYDRQSSHERVGGSLDHDFISLFQSPLRSNVGESVFTINEYVKIKTPLSLPEIESKTKTDMAYHWGMDAGLTFWDWNQSSNANVDISSYEREQLSYNINSRFGIWLNRYFTLETGVGFKSFESEFNGIFNSHYVEVSDTIDQPIYNVITRVTSYEDNAVVDVFEQRTIRHFNSIKQVNIPLIASLHFGKSKWDYSVGLGTSLTYLISTQGRSINEQSEFVEYDENTTLKSYTGLNLLARLGAAYEIQKNLMVYGNLSFNQSLHNWNTVNQTSRTPYDFNVNLGVRKRFSF